MHYSRRNPALTVNCPALSTLLCAVDLHNNICNRRVCTCIYMFDVHACILYIPLHYMIVLYRAVPCSIAKHRTAQHIT